MLRNCGGERRRKVGNAGKSFYRSADQPYRRTKNKSNCKCIRREARLQSSPRNWSEAWLYHRSGDFETRMCSRVAEASRIPRRSLYPANGKRHTSWKCKLTALPPFYRAPFVIFLFVPRNTRSVSIRTFVGEGLRKKI